MSFDFDESGAFIQQTGGFDFDEDGNPVIRGGKPSGEGGFIASVKSGIGSAIKGAGQAAGDFIPGVDSDNALKRYGQGVIDANPTAIHSLSDVAESPWTAAKEAVGNAGGSVAEMLAVRAIGQGITAAAPLTGPFAPATALAGQAIAWFGPAAIAALPSYGGIRDKQIVNDPANNDDWKSKAIASLGAATVGAIETKFGPQQWALSALTKEGRTALAEKFAETTLAKGIGFGMLKGGAIEGAEELAQNPIEQLASYDDPTSKASLQETAFSGVMGAIGGGVLGGAAGAMFKQSAKPAEPTPDRTPEIFNAPDVDSAINAAERAIAESITQTTGADLFARQAQNPLQEAINRPAEDRRLAPTNTQPDELLNQQLIGANPLMDIARGREDRAAVADQIDQQAQQQKQMEVESIPSIAAEQNTVKSAVERAATLEAPTALEMAFQRAREQYAPAEAIVEQPAKVEPQKPTEPAIEQPRIIERAPGLLPMSFARAEQVAAKSPELEVVRFPNINRETGLPNGKFSYTVQSKVQDDRRTGDVRIEDSGSDRSRSDQSIVGMDSGVGASGAVRPAVDAGSEGDTPNRRIGALGGGQGDAAIGKVLRKAVDDAEPMSQAHSDAIEAYQSFLTDDAKKSLDSGEMPVFQSGRVTVAITPSAQSPGMVQATRYNDTGAIGDSQYKSVEAAILGESLVNSERLPADIAQQRMADVAEAESVYQAKRDAFNVENAQPRSNPQAEAPRIEAPKVAAVGTDEAIPAARQPAAGSAEIQADGVGKKSAKEYLAEVAQAREDAKLAAKNAPRETVTPAEDKNIGTNDAGNQLFERNDGSVYQMENGRPRFGGDLVAIEQSGNVTELQPTEPRFYVTNPVTGERTGVATVEQAAANFKTFVERSGYDRPIEVADVKEGRFWHINTDGSFRKVETREEAIARSDKQNAQTVAERAAENAPRQLPAPAETPAPFKSLLSAKSTAVILDDGKGRILYEVKVTPEFRNKNFVNGRMPSVKGLELVRKEDVTKNPSDNGWVLIDNRAQIASREAATPLQQPAPVEVSRFNGKFDNGMNPGNARIEAVRLNGIAQRENTGITYTAEAHGDPKLENPYAVVGRKVSTTESANVPQADQAQQSQSTPPTAAPRPELTPAQRSVLADAIGEDLEREYQAGIKQDIQRRLGRLPAPKEVADKQSPFKSFLKTYGISDSPSDVVGEGNTFRANQALPSVFRKAGLGMDELAIRAEQNGFITQADIDSGDANGKLVDMVRNELRGEKQLPMGMQDDAAQAANEKNQRQGIESIADSLGLPYDADTPTDRLASMVARIERTLAQPRTGLLKADRILRNAREKLARIEAKRAQFEAQFPDFDEASTAEQDAVLDVLIDEDGLPIIIRTRDVDAVEQEERENKELTNDARASQNSGQDQALAERVAPEGIGANQENGPVEQRRSDQAQGQQEGLVSPTREDILAQQDRADAATKQNESQRLAADKIARDEEDRKRIAKASEAAAGTFELGGNALDNLTGQGDIFSAPAEKPASEMSASELLRAAADKMDAAQKSPPAQAKRTNPTQTIEFKNPIVGPSGEKLLSYTWQWKPFEYVDKTGEERTGKLSDWDKSAGNVDTGRNVVHQFTVENKAGETRIVSAESAIAALGYADKAAEGSAKSVIAAVKTLARNKMQLAELESALSAFTADQAEVNNLDMPGVVQGENGWWSMGDATVRQTERLFPDSKPGELLPGRMKVLEEGWRSNRMTERGWNLATENTLKEGIYNTKAQIKRAQAKLDAIAPVSQPAQDSGLKDGQAKIEYPLAPAGTRYEETSKPITMMTPDAYLAAVRPLDIDEASRDNIDDLKAHILSGKKLDPLHIRADGKEDGRHRAVAAKELGIAQVPVIDDRPAAVKSESAKIENFGEELPPARRTIARQLSEDLTDDAIAKMPLSQVWPASENDAIEDPFVAAAAHVMREAIPSKPRTAYKVKTWVQNVQLLRSTTALLVSGRIERDRFIEKMSEGRYYALRNLLSKIKFLEKVDRTQWGRIGDVQEWPDAVQYDQLGNKVSVPQAVVTIDGKIHNLKNSGDLNDHMDAVTSLLAGEAKEKRMAFEIRGRSNSFFINKTGDKQYRHLMEFTSAKEASNALENRYEEVVAAWEAVKEQDNITERDLRAEDNRPRSGKDWRNGKDVSAEDFQKQFGFKGGEFGKWVSQGKGAQERQFFLNSSYDALMDLADIVGIPPDAISLEGTLGIAFGSRGNGWASAHFEPSNLVINLTKPRGAGSLAHEWFHALDNYFARKRGGEVPMNGSQVEYRNNNYLTHRTTPMMVRKDGRGTPTTRERLAEWRKSSPGAGYLAADQWIEDPKHKQGVRAEVEERFENLVKALSSSPMAKRARVLDGVKENGDGYWSRTLELAARSFENYVQSRMLEQGYHNDFLANVRDAVETGKNLERYPYLMPSEIAPVADAFASLFNTIQTKETERGTMLFSRSGAQSRNGEKTRFTRTWYDRLVSLLPESYRGDSYRREPLPADDRDVQRTREVQGKVDALNQELRGPNDTKGYGPVSIDALGNLQVDARQAGFGDVVGGVKALADEIGYGVVVTGVRANRIQMMRDAGFESEISLAAVADRLTGVREPEAKNITDVRDTGTVMSYKPRGFPMVLFSRGDTSAKLVDGWSALAQGDGISKSPKSSSTDLPALFAEVAPGFTVIPAKTTPDMDAAWRIYPNGKPYQHGFILAYKDGRVELNLPRLNEGDGGSSAYAATGNWALNAGRKFAADRYGLSQIGEARRLENLASLAVKFGTTKFMEMDGNTLGVDWTDNDQANISNLLTASYERIKAVLPEIDNYDYDFTQRQFVTSTEGDSGVRVVADPAKELVGAARAAGLSAGSSTIQRAILTGTLIRGQGLLQAVRETINQGLPGNLRGLLYGQGNAAPLTPITTIREALASAYGKLSSRLEAKGLLTIHQTQDEAMQAAAQARADVRGTDAGTELEAMGGLQAATVWHGSPHKFSKFDSSKIGTGEGAQVYGHGLYLAESPEVAKGYKTTLSPYELVKDGKQIPYEQMDTVAAGIASDIASKKGDVKAVRSMYEIMAKQKFGGDVAKQRLAALDSMGANVSAEKGGSLYKVDLPDEHIAKMLDWDKPLSQQSPGVLKKVKELERFGTSVTDADWSSRFFSPESFGEMTGAAAYGVLEKRLGANGASEFLKSLGIPGIRYLDGVSRARTDGELIDVSQKNGQWFSKIKKTPSGQVGDVIPMAPVVTTSMPFKSESEARQWAQQQIGGGTSNYVVFPGNEHLLDIQQRNGIDIKRSADGHMQGFHDTITGKSFLVSDHLTAETAPGVLIHEIGVHAASDGALNPMHDRASELVSTDKSDFMREVAKRMDAAGETTGEEAAAYITEAYENNRLNAPKSVRQWVKDYIAAIRGWLYKKGILIAATDLTPADIAAIARANARQVAKDGAVMGEGGLSMSESGESLSPGEDFWRKIKAGESFTEKELEDVYSQGRRGTERAMSRMAGKTVEMGAGPGEEIAAWAGTIAGFDGYRTVGVSTGEGTFIVGVIPEEIFRGGDSRSVRETAIVTYEFTPDGDKYRLDVGDPLPTGDAFAEMQDRGTLESTGDRDSDGQLYFRAKLEDRYTTSRALLQESVRRLALHAGKVPTIIQGNRETGARADLAGNREYSADRVEMKLSRSLITGQTNRQYDAAQLQAMKNVGFQVEVPTLQERAQALWKDAGKKMAQGIVDQFAPIKDISKEAYGLMRLSKGSSGAFEVLLNGGKLKLTDGVYDFDDANKGGVVETLLIPLQGEHHDFMRWVAANRAERLLGDDKEHLFTQQDVDALKTLASGTTAFDYTIQNGAQAGQTTRDRTLIYRDSLATFNAFNKNVLDLAEQSGLIDPESRKVWEHEFYVPFYRVADDESGGVRGMNIKGGVVRQQAFKTLKGGKNALNADLLDNTLMNWAHLLDASAKNRAAKATIEAAEAMGVATGGNQSTLASMGASVNNKNGVVWYMDGGQKRYSLIDDADGPYLMTAITALEYSGMRNPVMNAMGAMKHALTVGVTASPFFKIRNLIRDSMQAVASGPISYNPAKNLSQGWGLTNPKSDEYMRLMAGGGTIHFGTMMEGSEAKRVQALVESGVDDATILNGDHKVKAFYRKFIEPGIAAYNELGNRGEAINRAALYDQLRKQGVNHADASLQARDLMDFSMQGSFTTIRFLAQTVPFFNARIVGLYKLGRAAKEDPARMSAVIGAAAVMSLSLLLAYREDDDWKKREEWDRNSFWWFKFGGTAFRIPKPFEVGAIATLAERGFELAFEKEMTGKRFTNQVLTLIGDNLSMNPIPQLVKPMLDVYANKNSFTGRPIETMGMDRLKSEYRFTDRTSMAARAASTGMNAVTGLVGKESLSPVQIDSLLRGYFGWLGSFVVSAGDVVARPLTDQPSRPTPDYWKTATGGMIASLDSAPSRYVSSMYEQAKEIEQAYATWRAILKEGKTEDAREFLADNKDSISRYHKVEAIKRNEAVMNQRIKIIERSNMSADQKRDLIVTIQTQKDRMARMAVN